MLVVDKPATVSEVQVDWFDDTGRGQVRVPKAWRILYKDASGWKPVDSSGEYGVVKDRYNTVAFSPVMTSALRLEVIIVVLIAFEIIIMAYQIMMR